MLSFIRNLFRLFTKFVKELWINIRKKFLPKGPSNNFKVINYGALYEETNANQCYALDIVIVSVLRLLTKKSYFDPEKYTFDSIDVKNNYTYCDEEKGISKDIDKDISIDTKKVIYRFYYEEGWSLKYHEYTVSNIGSGAFGQIYKIIGSCNIECVLKFGHENNMNKEFFNYRMLTRNITMNNTKNNPITNLFLDEIVTHALYAGFLIELFDTDLSKCIKSREFTLGEIKFIMSSILKGLEFMHSLHYMHLDIKPANIFIKYDENGRISRVAIGDLGISKMTVYAYPGNHVVTRWYRAPELIKCKKYSTPVDIWSVGCIFAEIFLKRALFQNADTCGELSKSNKEGSNNDINKIFGIYTMINSYINNSKFSKGLVVNKISKFVNNKEIETNAISFIDSLMNPNKHDRISASKALEHPFLRN